jgi:hypothetical protein
MVKRYAQGMSLSEADAAKKKAAIGIAALSTLIHQRRFLQAADQ